ncbi:hypothetical protein [Cohnella hashimotonis]|uniref:Uncharacterized protein n=1 Tax=Cohnella hashimotonis TaxID=2826895 RepID=A0ABT6TSB4_9BACL|nr:hypothetical protein [Cohnella hashimotonis]MDI4649225.1 hypothetical protein [Cohnella hashimotonis]
MKGFKRSFFIFAVVVALMSLSSVSAVADSPYTDILTINNANLNNGGSSWSQQSGYDYAQVYISNSQSQTLNVYLSYDLNGSKQQIYNGTVSANRSLTINVTHASGHVFYVNYNTANGTVSGKINVRASDGPL